MAPTQVPDRHELAKQEYFNQPDGFPFEGFELQDVLLPPGETMGINSDDDDEEEDIISSETGFGSAIGTAFLTNFSCMSCSFMNRTLISFLCAVIDGLPIVTVEKFDKLKGVILKHCSNHGHIRDGTFQYL